MDEIRIYDRALNQDEIKHVMKGEHTGYRLMVLAVNGYVTVSPEKDHYMPGETVELIVHPAQGYTFKSWVGDLSGDSPREIIVMDGNKAVGAACEPTDPPGDIQ